MAISTITTAQAISERRFYSGMALAILVTVLVGFARSFFLRPLFPGHPSPPEPIFYIHGATFTLWIFLLVAQTVLISKQRIQLHRQIGPAGGVLAVFMVILGTIGALTAAGREVQFMPQPVPPLAFLAVPVFDMIIFPIFIAAAFVARHDSQSHKRWMLLATFNLTTAAIARWPVIETLGPLVFFPLTDLFIVALAIWDIRTRGKLHPVTLWGGLVTIISQPLRLMISGTDAWLAFAEWSTGMLK
jgi:hypothetical protein